MNDHPIEDCTPVCFNGMSSITVLAKLNKRVHAEVWNFIHRKRKQEHKARRRKSLTFKFITREYDI